MDLNEMLAILWRAKWIVLITAVLTAGITGFFSLRSQIVYRADAVLVAGNNSAGQSVTDDKLAATYANLADIREVLDKSVEVSGIDTSWQTLRSHISTSTTKDSPYVTLTATGSSPDRVIEEVNAVAQGLTQYVTELQKQEAAETQQRFVEELTKVQTNQDAARKANPNDPNLKVFDDVRASLLKQYEQMNVENLAGKQLRVVSLAQESFGSPPHRARDIILAFVIGTAAGIGIGFTADSIKKALGRLPEQA